MDKEQSRKYGIPIYTQAQMDSLRVLGIWLVCIAAFCGFILGYVVGHICMYDLKRLADFFR